MSKPRKADRPTWLAERQQQAAAAAIDGHGWVYMANLWDCSTPAALQWSKENIDPEICRQIALNGFARRQGQDRKSAREDRSKPQADKPKRQSNGKVLWLSCQYTIYEPGQPAYICNAPTDNHAQYCKICAPKVLPITSNRRDTIRTYID